MLSLSALRQRASLTMANHVLVLALAYFMVLAEAFDDGLTLQGKSCDEINVRQSWEFVHSPGVGDVFNVNLKWVGVDPAVPQALDASRGPNAPLTTKAVDASSTLQHWTKRSLETPGAFNLEVTAPLPSVCSFDDGYDYVGADVGGQDAASPQECCQLCGENADCKFFSYQTDLSHCLFKSSNAGRSPNAARVSGASPNAPVPGGGCSFDDGYDYVGADVGGQDAASPQECCQLCGENADCKFFSYQTDLSHCLFKSSNAGRSPNAARVSGASPDASPTPAPHTAVYCLTADTQCPEQVSQNGTCAIKLAACTDNDEGQQWVLSASGALQPFAGAGRTPICLDAGTVYANAGCKLHPDGALESFCDPQNSTGARADALVEMLTLDEKVNQLLTDAPAVPRLGLPAYQYWGEALHGVIGPGTTVFPQVIGLAATFNRTSWLEVGATASTELRAAVNGHICVEGSGQRCSGLSVFAPNVNLLRDPRWGRGHETPGEDPLLSASYAAHFVRGIQGDASDPLYDSRYLKAIATCKHFDAYDLENFDNQAADPASPNTPPHACDEADPACDRTHFNAIVTEQELEESFLPPFTHGCVASGSAKSIMCSYNAVNGVPSCANAHLNNEVLRDKWQFDGYIVSDCGGVSCIEDSHHYTNTTAATCAAGLHGGCDLDCGSYYGKCADAAATGQAGLKETDIDTALRRVFSVRFATGEFEPDPTSVPYRTLTPQAHLNTSQAQALALQTASESLVLLKNEGPTLPLAGATRVATMAGAPPPKRIIAIGPGLSNDNLGDYHGTPPIHVLGEAGLVAAAAPLGIDIKTFHGCDVNSEDVSGIAPAVAAVRELQPGDSVLLWLGLDASIENEGQDRPVDVGLSLPGQQGALLDAVAAAANATGASVSVVLVAGGPVDVSQARDDARVGAILWVGYAGQAAGTAIARAIFGETNPGGRYPVTTYPASYNNTISYFEMSMRKPPGRSYKFYTGSPVYPFGAGGSYTTFEVKWLSAVGGAGGIQRPRANEPWQLRPPSHVSRHLGRLSTADLARPCGISFRVRVTNTGPVAGDYVALAFITAPNSTGVSAQSVAWRDMAPIKELFGFERVTLAPGGSIVLDFNASFGPIHAVARTDCMGSSALGAVPSTWSSASVDSQGRRVVRPGRWVVRIGGPDAESMAFDATGDTVVHG